MKKGGRPYFTAFISLFSDGGYAVLSAAQVGTRLEVDCMYLIVAGRLDVTLDGATSRLDRDTLLESRTRSR